MRLPADYRGRPMEIPGEPGLNTIDNPPPLQFQS
jgi:hypothetical protein